MEKKITIKGEELTIKFNLGVQCAYERITKQTFNLADFNDKTLLVALFQAAIVANNKGTKITLEYLMEDATMEEINDIDNAVSETMKDWLHIPDVIKEEPKPEEEGEQPKN
jgi:hypothetical protein